VLVAAGVEDGGVEGGYDVWGLRREGVEGEVGVVGS